MAPELGRRIAYLIAFIVVSTTVVGFFVGLQSPMNPALKTAAREPIDSGNRASREDYQNGKTEVVPATSYSEISSVLAHRSEINRTSLSDLQSSEWKLMDDVVIHPGEKEFALQLRERNRAFNGAPPTVPHPTEQMSAESCLLCHGEGFRSESFRISKMSHQFLTNCTQCHVESNPAFMEASLFGESEFVGLPAPSEGSRAYHGAPPVIPHSTWMRVDCLSCHGATGQQGLRTTHPWRQNCQQCHVPSTKLEQVQLMDEPIFLPPIEVSK